MRCPMCHQEDTKVIESRVQTDGHVVRRRRKCEACQKRFTTYEKIEVQMPIIVKSDGRREAYNSIKIREGIEKACQKRPITTAGIDNLVDSIERKVACFHEKEISTKIIGEMTMEKLYKLDSVAYVRFASCYWKFEEVNEFVNSLQSHPGKAFKQELLGSNNEIHK